LAVSAVARPAADGPVVAAPAAAAANIR
jgi:hypothetical protein